ncbi:MAG TPA: protein kinase [Gemmatimonadaceae bacterium]|nr:protein kinase [Gemmatimonadaceae bacterium]
MTLRTHPIADDDDVSAEIIAALAAEYILVGVLDQGEADTTFVAHRVGETRDHAFAVRVARDLPELPAIQRFISEIEITASLRHPRILPVRPIRKFGGFLVSEARLAAGGSLEDVLFMSTPFPTDRVYDVLHEIAEALDFAESQEILHGALRPAVVGLDAEGHVTLSGFMLRMGKPAASQAVRPSEVGDPAYTSVEQRHDERWMDGRADQYALAVLAWELLVHERRARLDDTGMLELDPLDVSPTRALRAELGVGPNVAIRKALSRDPRIRFESSRAFVEALNDRSVTTPHGLPTYHDPVATRRASPLWALVPLLLVGVGLVAMNPVPTREFALRQWQSITGRLDAAPRRVVRTPTLGFGDASGGGSTTAQRNAPQSGGSSASSGSSRGPGTYTDPTTVGGPPAPGPRIDPYGSGTTGQGGGTSTGAAGQAAAAAPSQSPTGTSIAEAAEVNARRGVAIVTLDGGSAVVTINGIPRGMTPATISLGLGSHVVRLRGSRVQPDSVVVTIAGGDSARVAFRVALP